MILDILKLARALGFDNLDSDNNESSQFSFVDFQYDLMVIDLIAFENIFFLPQVTKIVSLTGYNPYDQHSPCHQKPRSAILC